MKVTKIMLAVFLLILIFVVGMRVGLQAGTAPADARIEELTLERDEVAEKYEAQLQDLRRELAEAIDENSVEVVYQYKPMPVDYVSVEDATPADSDAVLLAKTMWGEYRDASNYGQCAAVCWCALNRVDAGYGTLAEVLTTGQFLGYSASNPVDADLYNIAVDVLIRHELEQLGANYNVGRVIPSGYLWMDGDGIANHYRDAYEFKLARGYITP